MKKIIEDIRNFAKVSSRIRRTGSTTTLAGAIKNYNLLFAPPILITRSALECERFVRQYDVPKAQVRSFTAHLEGIHAPIVIDKDAVEVMLFTLLEEIDEQNAKLSLADSQIFQFSNLINDLTKNIDALLDKNLKLSLELQKYTSEDNSPNE